MLLVIKKRERKQRAESPSHTGKKFSIKSFKKNDLGAKEAKLGDAKAGT